LAAGEGALPEIFFDGFSYPYFPGFRRYIPALAIAAFFAMIGFSWLYLNSEKRDTGDKRETGGSRSWLYATAATACFAYCVYSYFYIWTTAAAFLACLVLVWIVERPATFKHDIKSLGVLVVAWGAAL